MKAEALSAGTPEVQCDTCIFDLYGTLVDIHTDENKAGLWERLALLYAYYGAYYEPEDLHHAYRDIVRRMSTEKEGVRRDAHESYPEIQIEQVFEGLFYEKGIRPEPETVLFAGHLLRILATDRLRLYPGTEEMLRRVRESGKKIYLLSNAQKIYTEYELNALKLTPYFDGIFLSSEHGCKKPDLNFFRKLLDRYEIDPARAVMIGNDGVCDIEGAKKAGLKTVYVRSEISPKEELPEADYVLKKMDMERIGEILTSL